MTITKMRLLRYNQQPFSLMFTPPILSHKQIHRRITSTHKKRCTDKQKSYSEHWLDYVNYISIELHYPAFEISADTCCKKPQIRYITTPVLSHTMQEHLLQSFPRRALRQHIRRLKAGCLSQETADL